MPSAEEAEVVIKDLDGSFYKDRKLRVRQHTPYNPHPRFLRLSGSLRRASRHLESEERPIDVPSEDQVQPEYEECKEQLPPSHLSKEIQYSETTLFVKGIRHKATEESLKEFFADFSPTNIKILRPRGFIGGFKPRAHSALVSFNLLEDWSLDHIIESCKSRLLDGYSLSVGKAFASRDTPDNEQEAPVERAEEDETASVKTVAQENVTEAKELKATEATSVENPLKPQATTEAAKV